MSILYLGCQNPHCIGEQNVYGQFIAATNQAPSHDKYSIGLDDKREDSEN